MKKLFFTFAFIFASICFISAEPAESSKSFVVTANSGHVTVTYDGEPIEYISWTDKSDPTVVLTTFFISYLEQSEFWKDSVTNLGTSGKTKDSVIEKMQESYKNVYSRVDKLQITINPEKFSVNSGNSIDSISTAMYKIKITYVVGNDSDSGEDDVLMVKEKSSGNWFVSELPL